MAANHFYELPLEALHDLLPHAVKEFLEAIDMNDESGIKIKRRQVELLCAAISANQSKIPAADVN